MGAVSRSAVLPRPLAAGDIILGLRSSGIHSNGFSLVRKIVDLKGLRYSDPAPFESDGVASVGDETKTPLPPKKMTLAEALLVPTRIYVRALMPLLRAGTVKALAHITGGGLVENIPRVLGADLAARLRAGGDRGGGSGEGAAWKLPEIFRWLRDAGGLEQEELLRTLNCGIGMVVVVAPERADEARRLLKEAGEHGFVELGVIEKRGEGPDAPQVVVEGQLG